MTPRTAAAAIALLVATGCGGGPERQEEPTPRPISAECRDAWVEAQEAAGSEELSPPPDQPTEPPSPVPLGKSGQAADLYPTLEACGSAEAWVEGFNGHPIGWARDMNAITLLRELCQYGREEIVRDSRPCADLGAADEPLDETTDVTPQPS